MGPWRFLEVVGKSQFKSFTRYITGLNCLRDLSSLLDHGVRVCMVLGETQASPVLEERLSLGYVYGHCCPLSSPGPH